MDFLAVKTGLSLVKVGITDRYNRKYTSVMGCEKI